MQSQLETLSPVLVQLKVEVPWQRVNDDLESAYRTNGPFDTDVIFNRFCSDN